MCMSNVAVYMYNYILYIFILIGIMYMASYMAIYIYMVFPMAMYIHWLCIGYVLVMYWLPVLVSYVCMHNCVYMY